MAQPDSRLAAAGARVFATLLRLLGATWRVHIEGAGLPLPVTIGALWHAGWLPALWCFRGQGVSACVSRSRDGERIDRVLRRLGYAESVRGSTSTGGSVALRRLVRRLAQGVSVALLTDGPRGPARRSHPGVVALARLSGVPITPVAIAVRPCLRARSWDRSLIPLPFATIVCRLGSPIAVPGDAGPEQQEQIRSELDLALDRLGAVARASLHRRNPGGMV